MGFTSNDGMVRVDVFKPTGNWCATGAVDMSRHYRQLPQDGLRDAINADVAKQWPLSCTLDDWLDEGGFVVCLEPYTEHPFPICLKRAPKRDGSV